MPAVTGTLTVLMNESLSGANSEEPAVTKVNVLYTVSRKNAPPP